MLGYIGRKYNFILDEIKAIYTNFNYFNLMEYNLQKAITDILNPTYSKIIIELDSLINNNDEILKSLTEIKKLNENIDLAIIAAGYSNKSLFIQGLRNIGYHNIYINYDEHDITSIKEYIIKFYFDNDFNQNIINSVFEDEKLLNLTRNLDAAFNNNSHLNYKSVQTEENICKTIGILGANRGIGTTTQAIQLSKFLHHKNIKSCYVELNETKYIDNLKKLYNTETDINNNILFNNIPLYNQIEDIPFIKESNYQYCVVDYGHFSDKTYIPSFLEKDIKICVCGFKPNEFEAFKKLFKEMVKYNNINYIFSFIAKSEQKEIINLFEQSKNKDTSTQNVYFSEYTPDPFSYNPNNDYFYEKLLDISNLESDNKIYKNNRKRNFFTRKR